MVSALFTDGLQGYGLRHMRIVVIPAVAVSLNYPAKNLCYMLRH
jgi:hypothetical protein